MRFRVERPRAQVAVPVLGPQGLGGELLAAAVESTTGEETPGPPHGRV